MRRGRLITSLEGLLDALPPQLDQCPDTNGAGENKLEKSSADSGIQVCEDQSEHVVPFLLYVPIGRNPPVLSEDVKPKLVVRP